MRLHPPDLLLTLSASEMELSPMAPQMVRFRPPDQRLAPTAAVEELNPRAMHVVRLRPPDKLLTLSAHGEEGSPTAPQEARFRPPACQQELSPAISLVVPTGRSTGPKGPRAEEEPNGSGIVKKSLSEEPPSSSSSEASTAYRPRPPQTPSRHDRWA